MNRLILAIAAFSSAQGIAIGEIVGSFPAEGGPLTIRAIDGPAEVSGIQIQVVADKGTLSSGNDPSPFQFFVTGNNKVDVAEVTLGILGGSAIIRDEITLDVTVSAGAVLKGTYGKGIDPVPFKITAEGADTAAPDADSIWAQLQKIGERSDNKPTDEYWLNRIYACRDLLADASDSQFVFLASQFGLHDNEADLNLAFGMGEYLLTSRQLHDDEDTRKTQNLVAKKLCQRFMKDQKALSRYYHLNLWTGTFLNRFRPSLSMDALKGETKTAMNETGKVENYWWHARNALLLMYATGSEENFLEKETSQIPAAFNNWTADFGERFISVSSGEAFRWKLTKELPKLTLPKVPFATWEGDCVSSGYFTETLNEERKPSWTAPGSFSGTSIQARSASE